MEGIFQKRIGGIIILIMLGISPMTVAYSFSEEDDKEFQKSDNLDKKGSKWKIILTEKVVDGKLELSRYAIPNDISHEDLEGKLLAEGKTSWTYVSHKGYQAGIVLFNGKASKIDDNLWKITSDEILTPIIDEPQPEFGTSLNKTGQNKELGYKIIFSGKMVESYIDSNFLISLMDSGLNNSEFDQNVKIEQTAEGILSLEKPIEHNQEFDFG